ncbi:MAG: Tryptophan synthase alpha chain [Labilithrix sp.]|jgi:hypothetical protein|nr:Tryptophan synthase alpha chain [Labilithrix sp.]
MNARPLLRSTLILALGLASLAIQAACARSINEEDPLPRQAGFAGDGGKQTVCIETRCPEPFATCEGTSGPCAVNLSSDVDHCGACDTPCPSTMGEPWSWVCSEGQCRLACEPFHADCNGLTSDGCETPTYSDPANCGGCGNVCGEAVLCWRGACGCPNGFTQCGDECVQLDSDNLNCGACGSICEAPKTPDDPRWSCGPNVTPDHTRWQCASASCDLQCAEGWGDCDDNFCGTGCEVFLGNDPLNCGACGNACTPGQTCRNGTCLCPPGTTACDDACVDLNSDAANCGACGNRCPGPSSASGSGSPTCIEGKCSYVCFPGFADCDGRLANGCEAHLATSQTNCGSCGTKCDVARGQPCVEGVCLTKPCEEPEVK